MYTSANIGPAAYSNAEVDKLFDQARAAIDPEERANLYRRIQEIAVEDLPYFWLVETESVRAHRSECRDFGTAGHFAKTAVCGE